eukprot:tig00000737_g3820.t1
MSRPNYKVGAETPSTKDGISHDEERRLRVSGADFIQETGVKLRMPQFVIATAIYFFHQFFQHNSFACTERETVPLACLYLASKSEEHCRKLRDIINVAYRVRNPDKAPLRVGKEYWDMKELLIVTEQMLLRALAFDMSVDLPYKYLLNYLKSLRVPKSFSQLCWALVNDSLGSTLALQYRPHVLAAGAIHLASRLAAQPLPEARPGASSPDVGMQILDVYALRDLPSGPGAPAPAAEPAEGAAAQEMPSTWDSAGSGRRQARR